MVKYELKKPFQYSEGGNFKEATFIELFEPTPKIKKLHAKVVKVCKNSFFAMAKQFEGVKANNEEVEKARKEIEDEGMNWGEILANGSDPDIYFDIFKQIFEKTAKINGTVALGGSYFDDCLHYEDMEGLITMFVNAYFPNVLGLGSK